MRVLRTRRLLVVLGAVSLTVASCNGADNEAAPSTTTTSTTATSTTTTVPPTTTTTALTPPAPAADAAGLAAQAVEAERAVRDPAVSGDALFRAAWTQQIVARTVGAKPDLLSAVLRQVPAEFRPTVEANARAAISLRAMTKPAPSLPTDRWRIVAPAPPEELMQYYKGAEAEVGVGWQYLASIHFVETKFGRIRGVSTAGAQGPMQFMPATWRQYGGGGDINSNRDAIYAAARLLKNNGAPQRMDSAIWNYNHDDRYVAAVKLYAERMLADERQFLAYHQWPVNYRMAEGDYTLLVGFPDVPAIRS